MAKISVRVTLQGDIRILAEIVSSEVMWPQKTEGNCYLGICMLIHAHLCIVEHGHSNKKVEAGV